MSQKSKIFKIPLRFEKKTLKPARVRSLSKIVHVFVILNIKSEVLLFQLPLKVDSTVSNMYLLFFLKNYEKPILIEDVNECAWCPQILLVVVGPLIMLLKIFVYLSKFRAPLFDDLGSPGFVTKLQLCSFPKY